MAAQKGLNEASIIIGVLAILVSLVYFVVGVQALLVLQKYFIGSVPMVSTLSGRILQASIVASLVCLLASSLMNQRMAFSMTGMAAAAVSFFLIAVYMGRVKDQAFMSNLQPNGTFMPVLINGRPFRLWDDKLMQVLYYFAIVLAILMLFGIVVSMFQIAAACEACDTMNPDMLRRQAQSEIMGV